jgi:DNA-binding SARP family transcriptional activator/predicted ATPase
VNNGGSNVNISQLKHEHFTAEMPTLSLALLGPVQVALDDRPLHFRTNKAQALLVYLAVEAMARPAGRHRREALMELLWPGLPLQSAQDNLRQTLYQLRKTIPALPATGSAELVPLLLTDRRTVQLNPAGAYALDMAIFTRLLDHEPTPTASEQAAALYRGDFLADFYLVDSDAFEVWAANQRASLRRQALDALERLAALCAEQGNYQQAETYARRQLVIDDVHESAHRQLMTILAQSGRRRQALTQYKIWRKLLADELGVEPSAETVELYQRIRGDELSRGAAQPARRREDVTAPASARPSWLDTGAESAPVDRSVFIGRQRELARLDGILHQTLAGRGQIAFVTGEAGQGKTSLLRQFARQAQETHADLVVVGGTCNAYAGVGDPYLPFREVMGLLTGEGQARWMGEATSPEHARRLWRTLPATIQALVEHGPQLIGTVVPGKGLLARATAAASGGSDWLAQLQAVMERQLSMTTNLEQSGLFGQCTNVLHHVAERQPLLIMLDDLHWADAASLGLLFHLGRRLAGSRILIVGAYRPDELAQGRDGERHPLEKILDEFKRAFGDVWIDLAKVDQSEGRAFVDAFLDTEPNRLGEGFRQALFQQTAGHPLFTVELLREMQVRGDLVRNAAGQWREGKELDWTILPARVEAVIAGRVNRLDDLQRDVLTVASVEGEIFTAEVVAQVQGMGERPLLQTMSQQLEKRHHLVRERGEIAVDGRYLSRYQFGHALFQQYLYNQLSQGERRRLHGEMAGALAALYADDLDEAAIQLAHHYTAAGDWGRAVTYLNRAGDLARKRVSLADAVHYYQAALAHWPAPDIAGQAQLHRKLGECLWVLGQLKDAHDAFEVGHALYASLDNREEAGALQRLIGRICWEQGDREKALEHYHRALAILEQGEETLELARAISAISQMHMLASEYDQAIAWGERALALTRHFGAEDVIVHAQNNIGVAYAMMRDKRGLALLQDSVRRALALGLPYDACRAYLNQADCLAGLDRYAEAQATLEELQICATRIHAAPFAGIALTERTRQDWLSGAWAMALARHPQILEWIGQSQSSGYLEVLSSTVFGWMYNDLGQSQAALQVLASALPTARSQAELQMTAPHLGQIARTYAALGMVSETAEVVRELLALIDRNAYAHPDSTLSLLYACRWLASGQTPGGLDQARACVLRLERADAQLGSPRTAAVLSEGRGIVALAEGDPHQAAGHFRQAATRWQVLGWPYDQARALSGLGRSLVQLGDGDRAKLAFDQALELIESLATQLKAPDLKGSFLGSPLVQKIRGGSMRER